VNEENALAAGFQRRAFEWAVKLAQARDEILPAGPDMDGKPQKGFPSNLIGP
jgi:hypothetical protein